MTEEQKNQWRAYFLSLHTSISEWKSYTRNLAEALESGITPPPPPENPPPPPNP